MTYTMKPLSCDPSRVRGMSERMMISHYENNYGGAVKRLNLIDEKLAELDYASAPGFLINGLKRVQNLTVADKIRLGTTIATNALLTRRGAKVGYVATKGFRDIPFIQRGDRRSAEGADNRVGGRHHDHPADRERALGGEHRARNQRRLARQRQPERLQGDQEEQQQERPVAVLLDEARERGDHNSLLSARAPRCQGCMPP